jgi:uncharacterized DUF497 family protein
VQFEWVREKAAANIRKYGVSFHEAAAVLEDPLSMTFPVGRRQSARARLAADRRRRAAGRTSPHLHGE